MADNGNGTEIAVVEQDQVALPIDVIKRYASGFVTSGLFALAPNREQAIAQAFVKVQAGQELGIPPFASMRGINIIEGKPELSGGLMATLVKRSEKYRYRIVETTSEKAIIEWSERTEEGWQVQGTSSYSLADALQAGLIDKINDGKAIARSSKGYPKAWEKSTEDMLFWRAFSRGFRRFTPDLTAGGTYYVEGEISEADVQPTPKSDAEDAEIIDVEPQPEPPLEPAGPPSQPKGSDQSPTGGEDAKGAASPRPRSRAKADEAKPTQKDMARLHAKLNELGTLPKGPVERGGIEYKDWAHAAAKQRSFKQMSLAQLQEFEGRIEYLNASWSKNRDEITELIDAKAEGKENVVIGFPSVDDIPGPELLNVLMKLKESEPSAAESTVPAGSGGSVAPFVDAVLEALKARLPGRPNSALKAYLNGKLPKESKVDDLELGTLQAVDPETLRKATEAIVNETPKVNA